MASYCVKCLVEQTGESGASPILDSGRTTSPEMVALVNGIFGHALDFDDVLSMMPAHPSAVIVPTLCADNDPLLETRSSSSRGFVEVEAVLKDGRRQTVRVDQAPGHPSRQLTWDDMAAKFMDCAARTRIDPGKAQRALGLLTRLETCADIGEVVALLH